MVSVGDSSGAAVVACTPTCAHRRRWRLPRMYITPVTMPLPAPRCGVRRTSDDGKAGGDTMPACLTLYRGVGIRAFLAPQASGTSFGGSFHRAVTCCCDATAHLRCNIATVVEDSAVARAMQTVNAHLEAFSIFMRFASLRALSPFSLRFWHFIYSMLATGHAGFPYAYRQPGCTGCDMGSC